MIKSATDDSARASHEWLSEEVTNVAFEIHRQIIGRVSTVIALAEGGLVVMR